MRQFLGNRRFQIQYVIIVPYLILTVIVMLAGAAITLFFVTRDLQERFDNQIVQSGQRTRDAIQKQETENLNTLYQIAFAPPNTNPGREAPAVAAAIATKDITGLKRALGPYFQLNALRDDWSFDRLIAFDTNGRALVDWQRDPQDTTGQRPIEYIGTDLSSVAEVQKINAGESDATGDKFTALIQFLSDRDHYYFYTVVPVRSGPNLVGGLLIAARLDNMVLQIERQSQSAITVLYDNAGIALASTVPATESGGNEVIFKPSVRLRALDINVDVLKQFALGQDRYVLTVNDREYEFLYVPLQIRGQQIGYFSVALAREFIFNTVQVSGWNIAGVATLLALGIVGIGYLVSRSITRPLEHLSATAEAISNGQFDQRSTITGSYNEFGTLAQAFNRMTEHLLRLFKTSRDLNEAINIEQVLDVTTQAASDVVPGTEAIVLVHETDGWHYDLGEQASETLRPLQATPSHIDGSLFEALLATFDQRAVSTSDLSTLGAEMEGRAGINTALLTRLMVQGHPHGLLALVHRDQDAFEDGAVASLVAISNMTATVLHNAILYTNVQRESRKQNAILQSIADGVVLVDTQDYIVMANRAAEELLGLVNWTTTRINFGQLPLQPIAANRELFGRADSAEHFEIGDRTLTVRRAPVLDEDEARIGEVIVMHDLSAEAAVSQAKTDFIATISHELRTPLTPIFGNLELMLRGYTGSLNEEQTEMLWQVRKRAGDINDIVKNMIMIASIEANTLTVDLQQQDIMTVLEATLQPLRPAFTTKGLSITITIPDDLPYVLADRELLKLILTQLLDNARRFTEKGGVTISAHPVGAMVRVDIADTGIGISKEARERLFSRFQRIEGNNSPERGGGLGLAITRQIVERQGGRVWVESTPGQGSVFSFLLPQAHEQALAVAQTEELTTK